MKKRWIAGLLVVVLSIMELPVQANTVNAAVNKKPVCEDGLQKDLGLSEEEMEQLWEEQEVRQEEETEVGRKVYGASDVDWSIYGSNYYREQLPKEQQELWDRLEESCLQYLTTNMDGRTFSDATGLTELVSYNDLSITQREAYDLVDIFVYEHPQYYFINEWKSVSASYICFGMYNIFLEGDDRSTYTIEFKEAIDSYVTAAESLSSDYEKEAEINAQMIANLGYDYNYETEEIAYHQSAVSALLMEHSTVCAGYAKTFSILMNALGIETICVLSEDHAWNQILIDGVWYIVDVTWNDTGGSATRYLNITDSAVSSYDPNGHHEAGEAHSLYRPACVTTFNRTSSGTLVTTGTPRIHQTAIEGGKKVSITNTSQGATIYYTTDGSTPTTSSPSYSGTFNIQDDGVRVKAIAVKTGYQDSRIAEEQINVGTLQAPTYSVSEYADYAVFTLIGAGDIYYTIDGSMPTTASTKYTGSTILYRSDMKRIVTINAIAVKKGSKDSTVLSFTVDVRERAEKPSLSGITVLGGLNVSLKSSQTGAVIYYTTDGSTPTTSSTRYTGSFFIGTTTTISAIAVVDGYTQSVPMYGTYRLPKVSKPEIYITDGAEYKTITLSGSNYLYYTTDGSTPTVSSTRYTGEFQLPKSASNSSVTLNVIAAEYGQEVSDVCTSVIDLTPGTVSTVERPEEGTARVAGGTRYDTAIQCAEQMRNGGTFSAAVIACADNFPDALTGCTLAAEKNAPILLVGKASDGTQESINYINSYVNKSGTIYLLGGTSAVPENVEVTLRGCGYNNIVRLAGASRYETNLRIVDAMSVGTGTDVVIASGTGYADSLSISGIAGATGMPIFLAGDSLSVETVAKIREIAPNHIYIIGGTAAVNANVESQARAICQNTVRIYGEDRYETSLRVANYFGMASSDAAVVAYGGNFPDGLTGGVLAAQLRGPVILVSDQNYTNQASFIENSRINSIYVMGGTAVISDSVIQALSR